MTLDDEDASDGGGFDIDDWTRRGENWSKTQWSRTAFED